MVSCLDRMLDTEENHGELLQQIKELQKLVGLQVEAMQAQTESLQAFNQAPTSGHTAGPSQQEKNVRQVKVLEGRYKHSRIPYIQKGLF